MDVISEMIGVPEPTGTEVRAWPTASSTARKACTTCPPPAWRRARPGRLLRRHGRRAAQAPDRRPHVGPPRGRDRRRPAHRRGDHGASCSSWSWPATRRRRSCSATPGTGRGATPTSGARPSPIPTDPALGRGDAALRHVEPDARPRRRRRAVVHGARSPPATAAAAPARPTATSGCSPTPTTTTSTATRARKLAELRRGRHFCLGAHLARLEARVALDELVTRSADYDVDDARGARALRSTSAASPACRHGERCAEG